MGLNKMVKPLTLLLLLAGCATTKPVMRERDQFYPQLIHRQKTLIKQYKQITDKRESGWLLPTGCDSAIWSYSANAFAGCLPTFKARANEYDIKGKFGRRPKESGRCWIGKKNGSRTTWSRDQAHGLLLYGLKCKDKNIVEDHLNFASSQWWFTAEGEWPERWAAGYYNPLFRGLLGKVAHNLGVNTWERFWPEYHQSGHDDYVSKLQGLDIYMRSLIGGELSYQQKQRIIEHMERDANDIFFGSLGAKFGLINFRIGVEGCLTNETYGGQYVRCEHRPECLLSQRLQACGILLEAYIEEKNK